MASWIKLVAVEDLDPQKAYFIGKKNGHIGNLYVVWASYLNGKEKWSEKPGIGIHFYGTPGLAITLRKPGNEDLVAIEVPEDHATRWRARRHPSR